MRGGGELSGGGSVAAFGVAPLSDALRVDVRVENTPYIVEGSGGGGGGICANCRAGAEALSDIPAEGSTGGPIIIPGGGGAYGCCPYG